MEGAYLQGRGVGFEILAYVVATYSGEGAHFGY